MSNDGAQDGPSLGWSAIEDYLLDSHNWPEPVVVTRFWLAIIRNSWAAAQGARREHESRSDAVIDLTEEVRTRRLVIEGPDGRPVITAEVDKDGPQVTVGAAGQAQLVVGQTYAGRGVSLTMHDGSTGVAGAPRYLELSATQPVEDNGGDAALRLSAWDHSDNLFYLVGVDGPDGHYADLFVGGSVRSARWREDHQL